MKIYIGSDHAGFELKSKLIAYLKEKGHEVEDKGAFKLDPEDDYPDFIKLVAEAVSKDPENSRGIVIGGSGQGEAIEANRFKHVRAEVYYGGSPDSGLETVKLARQDNDSNVLSLGARLISEEEAKKAVEIFLSTPFGGGRHQRRIEKLDL
ncbi:ribose-5-phosphate isomerase [Candidatus Giovannonibacteria bacterium RIFCSPLOWO2_02_FULL_43_11b]|uniref:Ribose-5-phosphate isomerase n=1 Tax=Candidatus Giovannonibacteria bacterium RIFCSPHIGHO2_12_FULL_43_15 TaxID=1798341 RepID=A0A1F5WRJ0_9BACT|nr:MAG: ribose-5-phosphate isomerase [Candidatus Giovannonibacteria bacterium RIFCSPHIGHO2_01_FULL_43_100]OGF67247.1 MAG: ribose-5-phosphate isomerase [Candidatus Giovannonibacteria bacterium RIFCSPHIGHO2_02_FULL_43_32]OGF78240.1 MAG: ribose-5-phosphate isomerase [Candidatus Giovannonibacteria bacterium RIFCSPHIGHO2_12_FULL_43_15]OGF78745.1 MAG: ribose-5-phosphate isomerase [Candidatus Giovannonibacteria bacterium RIFCSPLOWO2_01_FULL_43_60]OGF90309.1 MAG: ribose-5-phosphate isomerase [Candidatu